MLSASSSISQRFIESLGKNLTAEAILAMEACLNCRRCGNGCAWYIETGDEHLHPKYKKDFIRSLYRRHLRPLAGLRKRVGLTRTPSVKDLRQHMPFFWKCSTCGRCTLACPLALSNRSVVRLARAAFTESGLTKENPGLGEIDELRRRTGHSFGLSRERLHLRLGYLLAREGVEVPVDVPGVEYLYAPSAVVNTRLPDQAVKIPKLLNAAGVRYTYSSRLVDTGSDVEHTTVNTTLSREILEEVEAEALRLGAEKLLLSECGCDLRTFYVDAGAILGRPLKVAVQALDSLLLQAIRSGALPVDRTPGRVTYHDACQVTRLAGLGGIGRDLLECVVEEVHEMTPNREENYCCNGGAGVLRLPENQELRRRVSRLKASQIRDTGAARVVTPCAVCMLSLEDTCKTYGLTSPDVRMSFMLFEETYAAVERALERRGETDRVRIPAVFKGAAPEFVRRYGLKGRVEEIRRSPDFARHLEWLSQDPFVRRYSKSHPSRFRFREARSCQEGIPTHD
jgi:Fe-S oxidoreductase